jgi:hypothetical protein
MYIVVDSLLHILSCTLIILDHKFKGIFSCNEMLLFLACSILQDNIHLYCAISTLMMCHCGLDRFLLPAASESEAHMITDLLLSS